MNVGQIIEALGLLPHPEGGYFKETWRDVAEGGGRGSGTAIYYLLRHGEVSNWHRVDATEIWHFYAGSPLELRLALAQDSLQKQIEESKTRLDQIRAERERLRNEMGQLAGQVHEEIEEITTWSARSARRAASSPSWISSCPACSPGWTAAPAT